MLRFVVLLIFISSLAVSFAKETDRESDFLAKLNGALKASMSEKLTQGFKSRGFKKAGNSLRKLAVTAFSNAYATSGFVYQNIYVGTSSKGDSSCSSPTSVYGVAVNRCQHHESFSYKYQIVSDSCKGAVVEYFSDQDCKYLLGTSDFEPYSQVCGLSPLSSMFEGYGVPVYQSVRCSTSDVPIVPSKSFSERSCGGLEGSFNSVVADTCSYSSSIGFYTETDCASSFSIGFSYDATTCTDERQVFSAICFRNIDYDPSGFLDDEPFMRAGDGSALDLLDTYQNPADIDLPAQITVRSTAHKAAQSSELDQDDKFDQATVDALAKKLRREGGGGASEAAAPEPQEAAIEPEVMVLYKLGYCPAPAPAAALGAVKPQPAGFADIPSKEHKAHPRRGKEPERRLDEADAATDAEADAGESASSWLITQSRRPIAASARASHQRVGVSATVAEWLHGRRHRALLEEIADIATVGVVDPLTVACLLGMVAGIGFCATLWAVYSNTQEATAGKGALLLV